MWEVSQGKSNPVWTAAVRDQQGDDPDENHYNVNNFIGALRRIGQFHNEHPEAARPPVTGETTGLTGSLLQFVCVDGFHIGLWKLIDSSPAAIRARQ